MKNLLILLIFISSIFSSRFAIAQEGNPDGLEQKIDDLRHRYDKLEKQLEDLLWQQKVGDVAIIDKVYITGPPKANVENQTAMGVGNPLKFWTYVFIPKDIEPSKKYPLLVLSHGGVHGDLTTYYQHIIREMMAQGYTRISWQYRLWKIVL